MYQPSIATNNYNIEMRNAIQFYCTKQRFIFKCNVNKAIKIIRLFYLNCLQWRGAIK